MMRVVTTHITSSSGPTVGRRGVWLELVLAWVLGLDSLVDLLDLYHLADVTIGIV